MKSPNTEGEGAGHAFQIHSPLIVVLAFQFMS